MEREWPRKVTKSHEKATEGRRSPMEKAASVAQASKPAVSPARSPTPRTQPGLPLRLERGEGRGEVSIPFERFMERAGPRCRNQSTINSPAIHQLFCNLQSPICNIPGPSARLNTDYRLLITVYFPILLVLLIFLLLITAHCSLPSLSPSTNNQPLVAPKSDDGGGWLSGFWRRSRRADGARAPPC